MKRLTTLILLVSVCASSGAADGMTRHTTRHYILHTNLTTSMAVTYRRHMDKVFDEYEKRFSRFQSRQSGTMDLYLFQKQEQYKAFLQHHGIGASNTGGIFFVQPRIKGLAT